MHIETKVPVVAADPAEARRGVSFRETLQVLWRRKATMLSFVVLVMAVVFVVVGQMTPTYTAEALVMIDERRTRVVKIEDVLSDLRPSRTSLLGQVEVVRSRELARKVIAQLELDKHPYFNPGLQPVKPLWSRLSPKEMLPEDWQQALGLKEVEGKAIGEAEKRERQETIIVNRFLSSLSVKQLSVSPVLQIAVTTQDPRLSARIANAVAEAYLNNQLESKFEATRRATLWLNDRLKELRERVQLAEQAVADYRARNQIVETRAGTFLSSEALSNLNTQLIAATAKRAEAEARYEQVRRMSSGRGGSLDAAGDVVGSQLIQRLREQESLVSRKLSELATRYGDKHPSIINTRAELDELRGKIAAEVKRIAESVKNELDIAVAREATLRDSLRKAQSVLLATGEAGVGLRELERDSESTRLIYETFLNRFKETSEQQTLQQADANILSYAVPPLGPAAPRKGLIYTLALLAAAISAVGLALLLEEMDAGLRSAEDVEQATGLPVLSMVPMIRFRSRGRSIADHVLTQPLSSTTESIRNLRTGLRLLGKEGGGNVLCVTSSVAGEGKSTLATWLGRFSAAQGQKVLLVDCDLRRPRLATMLGTPSHGTLVQVLAEEMAFDDAISVDERSGMHYLASADSRRVPHEILGSGAMHKLVEVVRGRYDLIILDAPPLLAVADARLLANLADGTLFLVRWGATRRDGVRWALKQLRSATGNVVGAVISQVNTRKHARYGYLDSGYYYGRYGGYYTQK